MRNRACHSNIRFQFEFALKSDQAKGVSQEKLMINNTLNFLLGIQQCRAATSRQ